MPREFTDNQGRRWPIRMDIEIVKRLKKSSLAFDIMAEDSLPKLASDPVLLCDVLFVICMDEADAAGVTDEDFGRGLGGDALLDATNQLIEAIVDFFPRPGQREQARNAMDLFARTTERALQEAGAALAAMPFVTALGTTTSSGSATKPEGSPESTPSDSPSGSSSGCGTGDAGTTGTRQPSSHG